MNLMSVWGKLGLRKPRWLMLEGLLLPEGLRLLMMLVRLGLRRRKLMLLLLLMVLVLDSRWNSFVRDLALNRSDVSTTAAELEKIQKVRGTVSIGSTIGTIASSVGRHGRVYRRCRSRGRKIHKREDEARLSSTAATAASRMVPRRGKAMQCANAS